MRVKWPLAGLLALALLTAGSAGARSVLSPRHSGLEPPGGPRSLDMVGRPLARTPSGGMGYTDAYGNTLDDQAAIEKPVKKRPKKKAAPARPLPDPETGKPLWTFQ